MKTFHLILIKPSHYDDEGYVIQWARSPIPSNSLAVLNGLALDCAGRRVLGEGVEIEVTAIDETNTRVRIPALLRTLERAGGRGLVGLVGVQTNQFPRAMDIARRFRERGVDVCIGGFHVSGTLAMLEQMPTELQEAQALGISLFAGEAEGRLESLLQDAWQGQLKPLYNVLDQLPDLEDAPPPRLPADAAARTFGHQGSFDAGRGCPFVCTFCTIINVQGRKSRHRTAESIERVIRQHASEGVHRYFITDDNFARNRNWEAILDRIIALRESGGIEINLTMQVDTKSHRIPRFVEKCARAGLRRIFIGLESIDPDALEAMGKRQNNIHDYRTMMLIWREVGVFIDAGYILGFPQDTPQRIRRDLDTIRRELPIDRLQFYCLTPLPGSQDHQEMVARGEWMEEDLNRYDLNHVTMHHPQMSDREWLEIYREAWRYYYSEANITTFLRRARASDASLGKVLGSNVGYLLLATLEKVHPLEAGFHRRKYRTDRRSGMPLESPLRFYPRLLAEMIRKYATGLWVVLRFHRIRKRIEADPASRAYTDNALSRDVN